MGKKSQQGNVIELVIIGMLVVAVVGLLVWRFVDKNQPTTNKSESSTAAKSDSKTQGASYLTVSEWKVKFALPDQIKSVSYQHDTSRTVFPDDVIRVTEITDASGKKYAVLDVANATGDTGSVDAICSTYGLGRSAKQDEMNATTGLTYEEFTRFGNYYYYAINGVSGAWCGQSESATVAVNAVMNMFDKPVAE